MSPVVNLENKVTQLKEQEELKIYLTNKQDEEQKTCTNKFTKIKL